jgi:hypothetical protein
VLNLPLSAPQPELIEYDRHQWGAIGSGGCGKRCIERPQAVGGHPAAPPAGSPKETPRLQTPSIMYRQGRTVSTPWLRMCCPRCPVTGRLSVGGLAHQPMPFEEPLDGPDLRPGRPAQRVARPWEGQHTALGIRGCHEPWLNVTNQRVHLRGGFARQPRGGTRVVLGPRRVGGAYRVRHVASQYWGRPSARPIALAGVPGRERRRASRRS